MALLFLDQAGQCRIQYSSRIIHHLAVASAAAHGLQDRAAGRAPPLAPNLDPLGSEPPESSPLLARVGCWVAVAGVVVAVAVVPVRQGLPLQQARQQPILRPAATPADLSAPSCHQPAGPRMPGQVGSDGLKEWSGVGTSPTAFCSASLVARVNPSTRPPGPLLGSAMAIRH